ncbi:MAG: class I SAM-dependent methyltransferase [bacterium]|nr:class I SAM-dependent methyltransferase [bacterium]
MTEGGTASLRGRVSDELKRAVVEHYEEKLARYGPTAQGMDWKDEASQELRFDILCGVCDLEGKTVHEVGCGAGHLQNFMNMRGIRPSAYSGSDLSQAMVDAARARHPGSSFEQRDILVEPVDQTYDVVLCSGLFHVKLDRSDEEWSVFIRECVRRMYDMCRVAVAFNLMSDQVDYRSAELHYPNTAEVLDFCRSELSRFVTLRHDYPLYESTLYVYKSAQ